MTPKSQSSQSKFLASLRKNFTRGLPNTEQAGHQAFKELESLVAGNADPVVGRKVVVISSPLTDWLEYGGLFRADQGDASGWSMVRDALEFRYWDQLVFEEAHRRDTRPEKRRRGISLMSFSHVLLAAHLGNDRVANAIFTRLVSVINEEGDGWRFATSGAAFQLRLYELWTGKASGANPRALPELGRYTSLLDRECLGERYREDLAWACEQHIAQTRESKQHYAAFGAGPFSVMPGEIVFWLRFRQREGLETSTEGHPLLASPAATLDPPAEDAEPSKYRRLLEKAVPHMQAFLNS